MLLVQQLQQQQQRRRRQGGGGAAFVATPSLLVNVSAPAVEVLCRPPRLTVRHARPATTRVSRPATARLRASALRGAPAALEEGTRAELWARVAALRSRLRQAVTEERYADAARLRDELGAERRRDRHVYLTQALQTAIAEERFADAAELRDALRDAPAPPRNEDDGEEEEERRKRNGTRGDGNGSGSRSKTQDSEWSVWRGRTMRGSISRKRFEGRRHDAMANQERASSSASGGGGGDNDDDDDDDDKKEEHEAESGTSLLDDADLDTGDYASESSMLTNGIRVRVASYYLPHESVPSRNYYLFGYRVKISNESADRTVQLVSRHWRIVNKSGHVEEVRGPGVVGKQPVLAPGESHEYTSACPLVVPRAMAAGARLLGYMQGSYQMVSGSTGREYFEVAVAKFSFILPE